MNKPSIETAEYNKFVDTLSSKDFHKDLVPAGRVGGLLKQLLELAMVTDIAKKALFYGKVGPEEIDPIPEAYKQGCIDGWQEYIDETERSYPFINMSKFFHGFCGVVSELPELANGLIHTTDEENEMTRTNFIEECGDMLFYVTMMLNSVGATLDDALSMNVDKLIARYPEGEFTPFRANNRDLDKEKEVMNGSNV